MEVVFKLAQKYAGRFSMPEKVKELYEKVLALDPEGKAGTYEYEYLKASIPYTEYAEYALAGMETSSQNPNPGPMEAFIRKYPESKLLKNAYSQLSFYYQRTAPKEAATRFFETYIAKYPEDPSVLNSYIQRIILDKDPLDKGIEIAEKINVIIGYPPNPTYMQNLAQLHILNGNEAGAEEIYGGDFAETMMSSTTSALLAYANFWIGQNKNLESAEEMADTAVKMSPDIWYVLQRAAEVYCRLDKMNKALKIYGPEYARENADDPSTLGSYAAFWNRQDQNLESAVDAARKANAASLSYFSAYTLGQILFKLKDYDEALEAAEKAVELALSMAEKHEGFPTKQYENLVKQIKEAMADKKK